MLVARVPPSGDGSGSSATESRRPARRQASPGEKPREGPVGTRTCVPISAHPGRSHMHPVLVVDYGAQYAQLIARRIREAQVYSEVVPHTATVAELMSREPAAIVLSGGPSSVYADGAPAVDPALFDVGVPVFGICYGFQAMAMALGGTVAHTGDREYGRTEVTVGEKSGVLHTGLPTRHPVWMSHGDSVTAAPAGFTVTAGSAGAPG